MTEKTKGLVAETLKRFAGCGETASVVQMREETLYFGANA